MPTITEYLKFANLQMAAEALYGYNATPPGTVLTPGDKRANEVIAVPNLTAGNLHASKFTATEATKFAAQWTVVEHISNTTTGFSGTLFKDKDTGELVLSFRSTEFLDDAARDNTATNVLEIKEKGWAFGQLSDMETWYAHLATLPEVAGKSLTVTGYSLGAHMATAFNLMHPGVAQQVITFNGAGIGKIGDGSLATTMTKLPQMIARFQSLRAQGETTGFIDLFQSTEGRDAYLLLKAELAATSGVPGDSVTGQFNSRLANLANSVRPTMPDEPDYAARLDDYGLLYAAVSRIKEVFEYAHYAPSLNSGSDAGPPNPANIRDLAPDGSLAIAGESLDYQLAVLTVATEFNTTSLSLTGGLDGALGNRAMGQGVGDGLANQWDVAGTEMSADNPKFMVAHSQYRYGQEAQIFIEDQPLSRGGAVGSVTANLFSNFGIRLLFDGYDKKDFGDTHSLVLLVDALNVQNTLLQLVPEAQRADGAQTLNTIFKNASWRKKEDGDLFIGAAQGQAEGDVLENVVNALAEFCLGSTQAAALRLKGSPDGNTWAATTDADGYTGRTKFYEALEAIAASDTYQALLEKAEIVAPSTDGTDARNDFAQLLALNSLAPFALSVTDSDALTQLKAANQNLASAWDADNQLTAEQQASGLANISDQWLKDRAAMLERKLWFGTQNKNPVNPNVTFSPSNHPFENQSNYFEDVASGYTIAQGPITNATQRYFFGGITDDTYAGGGVADHLYGNAGNDTLIGNAGADHLEGGADDDELNGGKHSDTLHGGTGNDTYVFTSGDGIDTIDDADGIGQIKVAGTALTGGNQYGARQWISDDKRAIYSLTDEADGSQTLAIAIGGDRILVKHFADNDLGIDLAGPVPPAAVPADRTIDGDLSPTAYTATLAGGAAYGADWRNVAVTNTVYSYNEAGEITGIISQDVSYNKADDLGNLIGSLGGPNRDDNLNGSGGADLMRGHGGDDTLLGNGGADRIEAGIGDDMANGGENDDQLVGDDGSDILLGGTGKDTLHGGIEAPLDQIYDYGENADATGVKGDWLDAGSGDDVLIGERGNDVLLGAEGADVLFGGAGDDVLDGDGAGGNVTPDWTLVATRDTATHGVGWHWTNGGSFGEVAANAGGVDALYGGAGDDVMDGGVADDYLDGGSGNDFLFGSQGADVLIGGAGNDQMLGDNSANVPAEDGGDYLDGGEGNDFLAGMGGADELFGGAGDDEMEGDTGATPTAYHGDDYLDGEEGNDTLRGDGGKDTLFGGTGNDSLRGDSSLIDSALHGDDYLDGEEGDDTLIGDGGKDTLIGDTGNDQLFGDSDQTDAAYHGDDDLDGGEGDDYLRGYGGKDSLVGGEGADQLLGEAGDDNLDGGAGDDILLGGADNDALDGGAGTDYLDGGLGDDTYILKVGDGGTAADGTNEAIADSGGTDTLRFDAGIMLVGIATSRANANDLLLDMGADRLVIAQGWGGAVERFEFADGTRYSFSQLVGRTLASPQVQISTTPDATLLGGSESDTLTASGGRAKVSGGQGNDVLRVLGTDNTILYAKGDGTDHVATAAGSFNGNVLRLSGVTAADLKLGLGSLAIQIGDDANDVIHFEDFDPADALAHRPFDHIEFDDGSTLSYDALMAKGFDIGGSAGNDLLTGTSVDDRISSGAGDDQLDGGSGSDRLIGGEGNDTYRLTTADDATDEIIEAEGQGIDTVESAIDYQLGDHLENLLLTGTAITGSGNALDNTLTGNALDNVLAGGEGSDTYRLARQSGDDLLIDSGANRIALDAGLDFADLTASRDGDDLLLAIRRDTGTLRVQGYFTEGTPWQVSDADGLQRDTETLLADTAAYEEDRITTLARDFLADTRLAIEQSLAAQGLARQANGTWARATQWANNLRVTQTEEFTTTTLTGRFNNGVVAWTSTGTSHDVHWTQPGTAYRSQTTARILQSRVSAGGAEVHALGGDYQHATQWLWAEVRWGAPQAGGTTSNVSQTLNTPWTVNGLPGFLDASYSYDTVTTHYQGALTGRYLAGSGADQPPAAVTLQVDSASQIYRLEEIDLTDGNHMVHASLHSAVIGGTGNNTIYNAGFAYGGTGNARLIGGNLLVAGTGDQWLENGATMVVGDGHNTVVGGAGQVVQVGRNNIGRDLVLGQGDQTWNVLDTVYRAQGIENWQEGYEHGGQYYQSNAEAGGEGYYDTLAALESELQPWASLSDLLEWGEVRRIDFLPILIKVPGSALSHSPHYAHTSVPVVTHSAADLAGLQPFYDSGVLASPTLSFGAGIARADLQFSWAEAVSPLDGSRRVALDIGWGQDQGIRVLVPRIVDPLGASINDFVFADGDRASLAELIALAPPAPDFDPDFFQFAAGMGAQTMGAYDYPGISFNGGLTLADVALTYDGNDVVLTLAGAGDSLRVAGGRLDGIGFITFDDGTIWRPDIVPAPEIVGTEGDDLLDGSAGDDTLLGLGGNDTLDGGQGDDLLDGGAGDDTYRFAVGGGSDAIVDVGGMDRLVVGTGIVASSVTASRSDSRVTLSVSATDNVSFDEIGPGQYVVESIVFEDRVWHASDIRQLVNSAPSGEVGVGGTASQGEVLTASNDLADADGLGAIGYQWQSSPDGDSWSDIAGATGGSVTLTAALVGRQVRVVAGYTDGHGTVESVVSTATALVIGPANSAPIIAAPIADQSATEDLPFAFAVPVGAFVDGDPGDSLSFTATLADGTALPAWLAFDAATASFSGMPGAADPGVLALRVTATDTGGLSAQADFNLAIGRHLRGTGSSDTLDYSASDFVGANLIDGGAGRDTITGSAGNDIIVGGAGSDTLFGGAGDDIFLVTGTQGAYDRFEGGDGRDVLQGSAGDDTFRMRDFGGAAAVERIDGMGGYDVIAGTGGADTLDFSATELAGIALIDGGAGRDVITGSAGDDVISGGAGADTLFGGAGNDTFLVSGTHAAYDRFEGGDGRDVLQGSAGDDTFRLRDFGGEATVERIDGMGGYDVIGGTGGADTLDFSATELAGIALIDGGAGRDVITGSAGDDVIAGGAGIDTLSGGAGNDGYRLGRGDGVDTIVENDATPGNRDAAEFLAGIGREQIWLRHVGNNLEARIIGTSDKLIVQDWYLGDQYRVEEFRSADGGRLLDSQVENLVQAMAAFAPPGAGQTALPPDYQEALAPVIAANWQ